MAKKKKRPPTFLEVATARVGVRNGARVMSFVICWMATHERLGRRPAIEEYAVEWKVSTATSYRELKLYREAFPEFAESPSVLGELLMKAGRDKVAWLSPVPRGLVADV